MKLLILSTIFVSLSFNGFAQEVEKTSAKEAKLSPLNFVDALMWFHQKLDESHPYFITIENCSQVITNVYIKTFFLNPAKMDLDYIVTKRQQIRQGTWDLYLKMRETFRRLHHDMKKRHPEIKGIVPIPQVCANAFRKIYLNLRYIDEYVTTNFFDVKAQLNTNEKHPRPYTHDFFKKVNPKYKFTNYNGKPSDKDGLKSGDIVMVRGGSSVSSTITRIGVQDSKYSHLALVYRNELNPKRIILMEALIEDGSNIKDFASNHLKLGRKKPSAPMEMIIRYNGNSELPKLAARIAYERLSLEVPQYDFNMDPNEHVKLFCSELILWAYEEAYQQLKKKYPNDPEFAADDIQLPLYPTSYDLKNRQFPNLLGMNVLETFAPGDIEIDPRFDVVMEWVDYTRIKSLHYGDAIFWKVFRWMENNNYTLKFNKYWSNRGAETLIFLRSMGLFSSQLSRNMNDDQLKAIMYFDKLYKVLIKFIGEVDDIYYEKNGVHMTFAQILVVLERFRKNDSDLNRKPREYSMIHSFFNND